MSVKTVMAFLNSELYSYFYRKLFGEVKVLKGNLINLPFARIDSSLNEKKRTGSRKGLYMKFQTMWKKNCRA